MAITEISKEVMMKSGKQYPDISPMDSERMLVLSLGTGAAKYAEKYSAAEASEWGLLGWVFDDGNTPIVDVYADGSTDMVDIHVSTLFQSLNCKKNYLRIQVHDIHNNHHIQMSYIFIYNIMCMK